MNKALLICCFVLLAGGFLGRSAAAQDLYWKPRFISLHYGSLAGIGAGVTFVTGPHTSVEASLGAPTFLDGGAGQPFAGNLLNLLAAVQMRSNAGIYASAGIHSGFYIMKANDKYNFRIVEEKEKLLLVSPRLALGYDLRIVKHKRIYSFEIGVSFLLPDRIERTIQRGNRTWQFVAERSLGGAVFPSYALRMRM